MKQINAAQALDRIATSARSEIVVPDKRDQFPVGILTNSIEFARHTLHDEGARFDSDITGTLADGRSFRLLPEADRHRGIMRIEGYRFSAIRQCMQGIAQVHPEVLHLAECRVMPS